jgi:hypothetical protein
MMKNHVMLFDNTIFTILFWFVAVYLFFFLQHITVNLTISLQKKHVFSLHFTLIKISFSYLSTKICVDFLIS